MWSVVVSLLHSLRFVVHSRIPLHLEVVALRHQLAIANRSRRPRLPFTTVDRVLWAAVAATARLVRGTPSRLASDGPPLEASRVFSPCKIRHRTSRPAMTLYVRSRRRARRDKTQCRARHWHDATRMAPSCHRGERRRLHRVLTAYVTYYMQSRTHLALEKDALISRRSPGVGREDRRDAGGRRAPPSLDRAVA